MREMPEIDCIVVGGVADGALLQLRMDAKFIELNKPSHLKPLASATQKNVEVVELTDMYEVHPIGLKNDDNAKTVVFSIAVVRGMKLTEAFQAMVQSYALQAVEQAKAERPEPKLN